MLAQRLAARGESGVGRATGSWDRKPGVRRNAMRDIGDDEQRSVRPQMPVAQRVAAARGRLLCCGSLEMSRIACVAASRTRSRGARNATRATSTTGC